MLLHGPCARKHRVRAIVIEAVQSVVIEERYREDFGSVWLRFTHRNLGSRSCSCMDDRGMEENSIEELIRTQPTVAPRNTSLKGSQTNKWKIISIVKHFFGWHGNGHGYANVCFVAKLHFGIIWKSCFGFIGVQNPLPRWCHRSIRFIGRWYPRVFAETIGATRSRYRRSNSGHLFQ